MQTSIHSAQRLKKLWFGGAFDAKSDKFRQLIDELCHFTK